jgi:hypothetical protein
MFWTDKVELSLCLINQEIKPRVGEPEKITPNGAKMKISKVMKAQ